MTVLHLTGFYAFAVFNLFKDTITLLHSFFSIVCHCVVFILALFLFVFHSLYNTLRLHKLRLLVSLLLLVVCIFLVLFCKIVKDLYFSCSLLKVSDLCTFNQKMFVIFMNHCQFHCPKGHKSTYGSLSSFMFVNYVYPITYQLYFLYRCRCMMLFF